MSDIEVYVETRAATVDLGGRDLTPADTDDFAPTRRARAPPVV